MHLNVYKSKVEGQWCAERRTQCVGVVEAIWLACRNCTVSFMRYFCVERGEHHFMTVEGDVFLLLPVLTGEIVTTRRSRIA